MDRFFKKNKLGRKGLRSHVALGGYGTTSASSYSPEAAANEEDLVRQFLGLIEDQTSEIEALKLELRRKESALAESSQQLAENRLNPATTAENSRQQSNNGELNVVRSQLQSCVASLQDSQVKLRKAHARAASTERELKEQLANALDRADKQSKEDRLEFETVRTILQNRLKETAKTETILRGQLAEDKSKLEERLLDRKNEFEAEKLDMRTRYLNETAERQQLFEREKQAFRADMVKVAQQLNGFRKRLADQKKLHDTHMQETKDEGEARLREAVADLAQMEMRLQQLDTQVQSQTETLDQTRLALNRTRNELNDERRKTRLATEESNTKSQQLEYVQQQCALLQEQVNHAELPKEKRPRESREILEVEGKDGRFKIELELDKDCGQQ